MTRLRRFAAPARQARLRSFAAPARQVRLSGCAASVRHAIATCAAVMIFGSSSVLACPMCFGAEETSMIDGTRLGILAMLAVTFTVQGAFVGFFFYLRKRAKRIADLDLDTEWSQLQRGPSRT